MQDYEASVAFLGTWGPFQRRVSFLVCLTSIPFGYQTLSMMFLLASPSHHCHIPTHSNLSQDWIWASIPVQQVTEQPERSSCSRYKLDQVQNLSTLGSLELVHNLSALGSSPEILLSSLKQEGCKDGWNYSTEYYHSTVVTEFNLVCSDQWKQPLTSLVYFFGGLSGCFISGRISDRFGRKPVVFGSMAMQSVFSISLAFAPSWPVFTVLYFMIGLGQLAGYVALFVLGSETLTGLTRVFFSNLVLPFVFVSAMMLLPAIGYLVRDWRYMSLIMAVPGLACIPLWWLVPESTRWLVTCGRLQEAETLLRSAALENQVEAPHVIFLSSNVETVKSQKDESLNFLDLLRTANIRNITLMLWLIWFSVGMNYFGLSFNISILSGNPYLNYFLMTVVELPAYAASWLLARSFPRRQSFISLALLGALALLLIQITLHGHPAVTLTLVLLGKFAIVACSGLLYVFTGEVFPTVIRNTAMSSCAMFTRVGSSVSSYLLQLVVLSESLPWIVVGSLSLFSVPLCLLLPETLRQPLPDTIQQMGLIQKFRWPWASTPLPKKSAKDQTSAPEIICTTHL